MKANRKFLAERDDAVSPVIAVILMVAITVVLAATVYVWVSGFSGQSGQAAASLSLTQTNALSSTVTGAEGTGTPLKFTITSISPGYKVGNLKILDSSQTSGNNYTVHAPSVAGNAPVNSFELLPAGGGTGALSSTTIMAAGDVLTLYYPSTCGGGAAACLASGDKLQFVDTNSNNVIATITLR